MAQPVPVLLIDDRDGHKGRRRRPRRAGRHRVADRPDRRARALCDTLARCVTAAWRARRRQAPAGRRVSVSGLNPAEVRERARAQGTEVNDRGRVPAELVARFKAATAG